MEEVPKKKTSEETNLNDNIPKPQVFQCKRCKVIKECIDDLNVHIQTVHKIIRVDLQSTDIIVRCGQCEYTCKLNVQLKQHMKKKHRTSKTATFHSNETGKQEGNVPEKDKIPAFKCNLCDFASQSIDQIWNHKLDKHTGQAFNFNNLDASDRNNIRFSFMAEQNADLMEEVLNLKKSMKDLFSQHIGWHEHSER